MFFEWLEEKGIIDLYSERTFYKDKFVDHNMRNDVLFFNGFLAIAGLALMLLGIFIFLGQIILLLAGFNTVFGLYIEMTLNSKLRK